MNWLQLFLSPHGRITRSAFWTGAGSIVAFQLLVQIPAMQRYGINPDLGLPPLWFRNLTLALDVICAWPLFCVLAKRQEDRDQGPRLSVYLVAMLLLFSTLEAFGLTQSGASFTPIGYVAGAPLLILVVVVLGELGFRRGTEGPNQFGPDPMQAQK